MGGKKEIYRDVRFFHEALQFSLHFNGHFSRWTSVSQYQNVSVLNFTGAKGDEDGGDNCGYKTNKAPVKLSPPTNRRPTFYRPDALPTNSVKALKGKIIFNGN